MRKQKARAYARYVGLGALGTKELADAARTRGMKVIQAYKPGMHFFYELALWGTPDQMRETESVWSKAELRHEDGSVTTAGRIERRKPKAAFGVNLRLPREKWVDSPRMAEQPVPVKSP